MFAFIFTASGSDFWVCCESEFPFRIVDLLRGFAIGSSKDSIVRHCLDLLQATFSSSLTVLTDMEIFGELSESLLDVFYSVYEKGTSGMAVKGECKKKAFEILFIAYASSLYF